MGLFNRGKGGPDAEAAEAAEVLDAADDVQLDVEFDAPTAAEGDAGGAEEGEEAVEVPIEDVDASGPYDISEAPIDGIGRVDLGAVQIPVLESMELHLENDESGDLVSAVVVVGNAALRVSVIAAPRSGGYWDEMRPEIVTSVADVNGRLDEVDGTLGTELRGVVPGVDEQGNEGFQPIRLFGIEGPRWCLHGAMLGDAAVNDEAARMFDAFLGLCVVSRGDEPMAPGHVVPLTIPAEMQEAAEAADATDGATEGEAEGEGPAEMLNPFERGPEITEIR